MSTRRYWQIDLKRDIRFSRDEDYVAVFNEVPRTGFDGPVITGCYADKTPFVQAVAQMYPNLDPHFIRTDGRDSFQNLETFLKFLA